MPRRMAHGQCFALRCSPACPRPKVKELPAHISQQTAKTYLPKGATIWRGNKDLRWSGHLYPRRRISCGYIGAIGEERAMRNVIARLWQQRAEIDGTTIAAICPWDLSGVLVDLDVEARPTA